MQSRRAFAALAFALGAMACGSDGPTGPTDSGPAARSHVLVGAGDIALCGSAGTAQTAALLDGIEGTVFTAGDNAYYQGSPSELHNCYGPTWGRHKDRTRPAPGNHDYESPGAAPYFDYFGASAGPSGLGYYSFEAGPWHVVSLNSSVPIGLGSAQYQWLFDDLAEHNARCLAAIWHHPRFSSGPNGPAPMMGDVWRLLQQFGAEFAVSGHDHVYERLAPLDATGRPAADGMRQFVAGTGGAPLTQFATVAAGSEVRISAWGVLKVTLTGNGYSWEFITAGGSVRDSGSASCR